MNTRIFFTLLSFLLVLCFETHGQNKQPHWEWARTPLNISDSHSGLKVVSDQFGSVFMLGNVGGPGYDGSLADSGFFVAKLRHNGDLLWTRDLPGNVRDLGTDSDGYLVVAGNYMNAIQLDAFNFHSNGGYDFYIARLDASGKIIWAQSYGGNGADRVWDLDLSATGNIHVALSVTGPVVMGPTVVPDTGYCVARILRSGDCQWAISRPSYRVDLGDGNYSRGWHPRAYEVESDSHENVYVLGVNEGYCEAYCTSYPLIKYNSAGQQVHQYNEWGAFEYPGNLILDSKNNIYLTYNTGSHYTSSFVLQKYSNDLTPIWSTWLGNGYSNYALSSAIELDNNDNPLVSGWIGGSSYSNSDTVLIDSVRYYLPGGINLAVRQLEGTTGKTRWIKLAGGRYADWAGTLCTDIGGNILLAGTLHAPTWPAPTTNDTCKFDSNHLHCTSTSAKSIVAKLHINNYTYPEDAVSVQELQRVPLSIAPNPGNGQFTIYGLENDVDGLIIVTDLLGKEVARQQLHGNRADLSFLKSGLYQATVMQNQSTKTARLVIR